MEKYLFIAEKPSLMRDVQSCYNKHKQEINAKIGMIDFIALAGHVCRNLEPDAYEEWNGLKWGEVQYPMIPKQWKVDAINDDYKKKTLSRIKNSIKDYDGIIVGTDSDVEGYGIYYLLETYLHLESMKALRFMEHSLTDEEILQSLLTMTDYHTDPVHIRFTQSYIARSRADWLFGMNGTRMVSVKLDEMMAVGRVTSATLKLVYDNSMSIENFKSKKYYQVEADYGNFTSSLLNDLGTVAQFEDKSKIKTYPLEGKIINVKNETVTEHAPKLYDLPAIQAEAGQKYGYTPAETLELAQSLYEKHKVISYPRTQCRYVSKSKSKEFKMMLSHMDAFPELAELASGISDNDIAVVQNDKQVVNDEEVNKESHDALLPTSVKPNPEKLSSKELNICRMIYARLLAQFLPKAADDKTEVTIQHGNGKFLAKGKTIKIQGWRVLYTESKDKNIPLFKQGDTVQAKKIQSVEKKTTPPKRLTQATLLNAMRNIASQIEDKELRKSLAESQGIGTPATRDTIISNIIKRGYVEDKKGLYITNLGKQYIQSIENLEIISPVFAATLDTEMKKIQRGESDYDEVYQKIVHGVTEMCNQIKSMKGIVHKVNAICPICNGEIKIGRFKYECCTDGCEFNVPRMVGGRTIDTVLLEKMIAGEKSKLMQFKKKDGTKFEAMLAIKEGKLVFTSDLPETNCCCPNCGEKLNVSKYYYSCPNEDFKVSRIICGKTVDEKMLEKLLSGETTSKYTFKKKDGSTFKAKLILEDGEIKFSFSSGIPCPLCGNDSIKINKGGAFCDCGLKIFRNIAGHTLTDNELEKLLKNGETDKIDDFIKKSGENFSAYLVLEDGQTKFEKP